MLGILSISTAIVAFRERRFELERLPICRTNNSRNMTIEFRCIRCGQKLRVNDSDAGNMARCPACEAVVDIPPKDAPAQPIVMARKKSDVIDFELFGQESQYVEITLDPSEVTFARMEHLLHMASGIAIEDAADPKGGDRDNSTVFQRISQVGRRVRGNAALQMTAFCNVAEHREIVAFAPKTPSRLIPLLMDEFDQQLVCHGAAILCLARGIEIRDKDLSNICENLTLCELRGDGIAVLQVPGQVHHRQLDARNSLHVATHRIAAFTSEVRVSSYQSSGVEEPVEMTTVRGPGEIWLSSGYFH